MGHSQAEKQQSHDQIVCIAARRFRESGIDGLSIANLMKEAGLTHGGFYKHFESRDELVAQALALALRTPLTNQDSHKNTGLTFRSLVERYLSQAHRDSLGSGCAVGALVSDMGRASDEAKILYTAQVKRNFETIAKIVGGSSDRDTGRVKAIVAFCAMTGALGLARAVSDDRLSNEILTVVREFLTASFTVDSEPESGVQLS